MIDGDHSGEVDDGDLDVWRHHYGGQQGEGALAAGGNAVPEPTVCYCCSLAWAALRDTEAAGRADGRFSSCRGQAGWPAPPPRRLEFIGKSSRWEMIGNF